MCVCVCVCVCACVCVCVCMSVSVSASVSASGSVSVSVSVCGCVCVWGTQTTTACRSSGASKGCIRLGLYGLEARAICHSVSRSTQLSLICYSRPGRRSDLTSLPPLKRSFMVPSAFAACLFAAFSSRRRAQGSLALGVYGEGGVPAC